MQGRVIRLRFPNIRRSWTVKVHVYRPNFRVFDIFGQNSGRRTPPLYFGAVETKKIGHFSRKTPFCRLFEFWGKTAAKIIGDCTADTNKKMLVWYLTIVVF